jgi:hypothetical protein
VPDRAVKAAEQSPRTRASRQSVYLFRPSVCKGAPKEAGDNKSPAHSRARLQSVPVLLGPPQVSGLQIPCSYQPGIAPDFRAILRALETAHWLDTAPGRRSRRGRPRRCRFSIEPYNFAIQVRADPIMNGPSDLFANLCHFAGKGDIRSAGRIPDKLRGEAAPRAPHRLSIHVGSPFRTDYARRQHPYKRSRTPFITASWDIGLASHGAPENTSS